MFTVLRRQKPSPSPKNAGSPEIPTSPQTTAPLSPDQIIIIPPAPFHTRLIAEILARRDEHDTRTAFMTWYTRAREAAGQFRVAVASSGMLVIGAVAIASNAESGSVVQAMHVEAPPSTIQAGQADTFRHAIEVRLQQAALDSLGVLPHGLLFHDDANLSAIVQ